MGKGAYVMRIVLLVLFLTGCASVTVVDLLDETAAHGCKLQKLSYAEGKKHQSTTIECK